MSTYEKAINLRTFLGISSVEEVRPCQMDNVLSSFHSPIFSEGSLLNQHILFK